jgi:hypothetical protein
MMHGTTDIKFIVFMCQFQEVVQCYCYSNLPNLKLPRTSYSELNSRMLRLILHKTVTSELELTGLGYSGRVKGQTR